MSVVRGGSNELVRVIEITMSPALMSNTIGKLKDMFKDDKAGGCTWTQHSSIFVYKEVLRRFPCVLSHNSLYHLPFSERLSAPLVCWPTITNESLITIAQSEEPE